jgi:hypothetical protein
MSVSAASLNSAAIALSNLKNGLEDASASMLQSALSDASSATGGDYTVSMLEGGMSESSGNSSFTSMLDDSVTRFKDMYTPSTDRSKSAIYTMLDLHNKSKGL